MRQLHHKLKSQSGVSVLVALILFLVASMVSVTILSAAVTAVKRVHDDRVQQQDYLAVSSAARLFAQCMEETTLTVTTVTENDAVESESITGSGPLYALFEPAIKSIQDQLRSVGTGFEVRYSAYPANSDIFASIQLNNPPDGVVMPEVRLHSFLIRAMRSSSGNTHYQVSAVFSIGDSVQVFLSDRESFPLTLSDSHIEEPEGVTVKSYTSSLSWSNWTLSTQAPDLDTPLEDF